MWIQSPGGLRKVSLGGVDGNPDWRSEPKQSERVAAQEGSGGDGRVVTRRED